MSVESLQRATGEELGAQCHFITQSTFNRSDSNIQGDGDNEEDVIEDHRESDTVETEREVPPVERSKGADVSFYLVSCCKFSQQTEQ